MSPSATLDRPAGRFAPGNLWSLLDIMHRFFGVELRLYELWDAECALAINRKLNEPSDQFATPDDLKRVQSALEAIRNGLDYMEWQSVSDRINLIFSKLRPGIEYSELHIEMEGLRDTVRAEFKRRWFCYIPHERAKLSLSMQSQWAKTIRSFPDTKPEIEAAHSCYSTDNNTASVFHSMRVAEHGLRALAKERKVSLPKRKPVEWGTWQEIIKALTDESGRIGRDAKAGLAKDRALEFYSGVVAELNGFKDEYRNLVMHVRVSYDHWQALRAINKVREFMQTISEKIDHQHHRIRWGLKFRA